MMDYEIRVFPKYDNEGCIYWIAVFPAVPSCVGGGDTPEEAMAEAYDNLSFYLKYLESLKTQLVEPAAKQGK